MVDPITGQNLVFMASWFNGEKYNSFDISQFGYEKNHPLEILQGGILRNYIKGGSPEPQT
jgi:hypothetical protein